MPDRARRVQGLALDDAEPLDLLLFRLRKGDGEHAVLVGRGCILCVKGTGESECAVGEVTSASLTQSLRLFLGIFALDGKHIVLDCDLDLLGLDARNRCSHA